MHRAATEAGESEKGTGEHRQEHAIPTAAGKQGSVCNKEVTNERCIVATPNKATAEEV
jgi:hypothetical protein